ncbi:MAG: phosphoribosylamine--glycine ligase, partial [Planctomycetota bacterium]
MNILLVGAGGREHALAWKISHSPLLSKLWIAPGNPGTAQYGENVAIATDDKKALVAFSVEHKIDLVVVGPEAPLVAGIADDLHAAGISCFGPGAKAAELEASKAFCKEVMVRHRIPTAAYRVFSDLNSAISYLGLGCDFPVVIKASGLAAGKGVYICGSFEEARQAAKSLLDEGVHGAAGRTIILEEFLDGPEASAFALTDGRTILPLECCQDHKQRFEGGKGPNTDGMGAICPNPHVSERTL